MRYVLPRSLTWWAGLAAILIGLAGRLLPEHGQLFELAAFVAELTGAKDAAPATLITLGVGLIGRRDRLERGFRDGEKP
jgi:branched-subunit amino acid ABC-type transport system permease component